MFKREDNKYSFVAKGMECSITFGKTIKLEIGSKTISFATPQELIVFTNYLTDVLDDYTETQRGENEDN